MFICHYANYIIHKSKETKFYKAQPNVPESDKKKMYNVLIKFSVIRFQFLNVFMCTVYFNTVIENLNVKHIIPSKRNLTRRFFFTLNG